jgi:2-methylcitrate dehydratase PrpD
VRDGVLAARLAAGGMKASADALEHRAGFLQAFSPRGRVRVDGGIVAGQDWHILRHGLNVKRYPVCYALHRSIDAALELAERHDLRPEQVARVEVRIGPHQAGMARHSSPENALDAKFSAEFAMAAALTARRVGLAELSDSFVRSAAVRALMPKVRVSISDKPNPDEPLFARHDEVTIRLADGTVLQSGPVRYAKGHARCPLAMWELCVKFCDCVSAALEPAHRDALFERLSRLETLRGTDALCGFD